MQLETVEKNRTRTFVCFIHLQNKDCELTKAVVTKRQVGESVNYDAGAATRSKITFADYLNEERLDEIHFELSAGFGLESCWT